MSGFRVRCAWRLGVWAGFSDRRWGSIIVPSLLGWALLRVWLSFGYNREVGGGGGLEMGSI